jgi:hypothetical protein
MENALAYFRVSAPKKKNFYHYHLFLLLPRRRHDIQHYDIQHNDIQHNDIQHNDIQHNEIQHKGLIWDTQQK